MSGGSHDADDVEGAFNQQCKRSGTASDEECGELEQIVEEYREKLSEGLSERQQETLDELKDWNVEDETA